MRLAFPGLTAALADGATVVTPTPLLEAVAVEQFSRAQLAAGRQSWERPNIFSSDVWMTACWQQARFALPNAPSLLSLSQEREVWRQVIERDGLDLFDLQAMAFITQQASRTIAEYQIPIGGDAWFESTDAGRFARWHQMFDQQLQAGNWITRSSLWHLLPQWISKGLVSPGPVTFCALSSISPGLKTLARSLGDSVCLVGTTSSTGSQRALATCFGSVSGEMDYTARAVRLLLESGATGSICLLVADLRKHSKDLKRALDEVLYPASTPGEEVHLHLGPMSAHPVISNALLFLELAQPRVDHSSAGTILRSPFIEGAFKERSVRAMADGRLRRERELDFSFADIDNAAAACPILRKAFNRLRGILSSMRSLMRPADWSGSFSEMLEALRWPALEKITDTEQSAVEQWQNGLSELASLGLISQSITLHQALSHLRFILSRPSECGDWSSRVQILDANAAAGIEFDHVFLLNACEDAWPPPISLSPLIPYKLQRLHQVPGSNPDSVAEEHTRKTAALFSLAACVQVSFTGTLSPLLRRYAEISESGPRVWDGLTPAQSYKSVELESLNDSQSPPLAKSEKISGGAGIIKSQSLCPFRAFAEYRLNVRGDDEASFGFDALERGECAHKALEYVWKELGSQQNLKQLSHAELLALIEKHVAQAVTDDASNGPIRTLTSLAERDRLRSVLLQWLTIDKERQHSFTVERLEEKREVVLSELKLSLRMDRVDRLPNGNLLLIDYKSGAQKLKKLEGDRPQEPQLLVYAAVIDEPIDGLYFAELKNRNARPVGHGVAKHFPKQRGTKDHGAAWDAFLQISKDSVHMLANEFKQGDAAVAPQKGACIYCKIKPICRVGSVAVDDEDED